MKICLGKQNEEIKKKDSETEKNLLKNRISEDINELDDDDIYFHSNAIKNIKLGSQLVNRIYLNHRIVYDLEDTIDLNLFHSLVPAATATSIVFDKLENQDVSNYNLVGYCDANNHIAVYNRNTEYIILNIRNAANYAPYDCYRFFYNYKVLSNCALQNFNTKNVTNLEQMFGNCNSLTSLDVSKFNTDKVTNMYYMFGRCNSLTSLDVSNFNTQNVTRMDQMFQGLKLLTSLDVSNFNTQNVTRMGYMFDGCSSLRSLDVSNFNTNLVSFISGMFEGCSSLRSLDVSNFNTQNVTGMRTLFRNCNSLTSLDISNFNTQNVTNMSGLFWGCSSLKSLDISNFNIMKLKDVTYMFEDCSELQTIISNTFTSAFSYSNDMFLNDLNLVGGNGTTYDANHTNSLYARVDGENNLPGYFTAPPATNNNK